MQKKLIALAVATAFSAPAFADNANVTFYGKAFLTLDSINSDQTGAISKARVNSNASRFGIKGSEDLGEGLKAIYQFEVQVDGDGSGGNGFGNGSRNTAVGLAGGFGELTMGNWDTPYKVTHNKTELFDNTTVWSATNLIGRANQGKVSFVTRQKNMIQYKSPSLGGVKLAAMYSPDEAKGTPASTTTISGTDAGGNATSITTTTAGSLYNKSILSLSATYDQDGIYAAFGYENRPDQTTIGQTDNAMRLVGRYDFGSAWLGATVERIKVNTSASASYTESNMELVGAVKFDANSIALSYAKDGKAATDNTGATQVSLRYGYNFSKRTELFAAYASLKNDSAAKFGKIYSGVNSALTSGTTTGATESAIGFGLIHSF